MCQCDGIYIISNIPYNTASLRYNTSTIIIYKVVIPYNYYSNLKFSNLTIFISLLFNYFFYLIFKLT